MTQNESANKELTKIKELLGNEPKGMSISDISRELGLNRNSVAKYVNMLQISGVVEMRTYGPAKVYYLSRRVPLSAMMDFSSDFIVIIDENMRIIQVNDNYLNLTGKSREDVVGLNIKGSELPVISDQSIISNLPTDLDEEKNIREIHWMNRDEEMYFNAKFIPTVFDDGMPALTMIAENITQQKKNEINLQSALREKEILLQEVHQRIRDNLQLISSILNLQASAGKDDEFIDFIRESQNRIAAITHVYENLYQTDDLSNIRMLEYIQNLVGDIQHIYDIPEEIVRVNIMADEIRMEAEKAIYCGLIINELVSNSLKYAFPDGRQGEISIFMTKGDEGKFILLVRDNGIGLPPGTDVQTTESLGLSLVRTIAIRQLSGTMEYNGNMDTEFTVTF